MAQVGIKSSEGFLYPIQALAETQGPDTRLGDIRLGPFVISAKDCAFEPEAVRAVLQPVIVLTDRDVTLPISVVEVSGTRTLFNLLRR